MLNRFHITSQQGDLLLLHFNDNIDEGYCVREITGLDPVKATLVSTPFAGIDGQQYQSSRRETRNITIRIELIPEALTQTVSSLRANLYKFFMPKSKVGLHFIADGISAEIEGRVESCETALFTDRPMMDVSVICFDPDFKNPVPGQYNGFTTSGTNEDLVGYVGTVETGFEFVLIPDRSINEFTVYMRTPDGVLSSLDFSAPLVSGDVLTISTVSGSKGATLLRNGTQSSILYGVSPQSTWLELKSGGQNHIRVYAEGAPIPFGIEYFLRYGGL